MRGLGAGEGICLNRTEARNPLAGTVFFKRLAEIRNRLFENQWHRASG